MLIARTCFSYAFIESLVFMVRLGHSSVGAPLNEKDHASHALSGSPIFYYRETVHHEQFRFTSIP